MAFSDGGRARFTFVGRQLLSESSLLISRLTSGNETEQNSDTNHDLHRNDFNWK